MPLVGLASLIRGRIVSAIGPYLLLFSSIALASCAATPTPVHPPVAIRLGGSDALQLVAGDLAEGYQQLRPYAHVDVRMTDSSSGLIELAQGRIDLAFASRNPTAQQLKQIPAHAVEIGRDGLVLVIHPSNPLSGLTRDQLGRVFAGDVLNWSDLTGRKPGGGADAIQVVSREQGSGVRTVFEQAILAGRRVTLTAIVQPSEQDVLDYVSANPAAVGYVSFNIWHNGSQTRALAVDQVAPTLESIQTGRYPLMCTQYLIVPDAAGPDVADFANYAVSADGQSLIASRMAPAR